MEILPAVSGIVPVPDLSGITMDIRGAISIEQGVKNPKTGTERHDGND
jgi:hypothetical protein